MASVIESEEELACLTREVEEELDQIANTCSWMLAQSCMKHTISNAVAVGDVTLLKMMGSESWIAKSAAHMATASALGSVTNSENLVNMRDQIASNGKELENLIAQMRSGKLEGELEEYREKIREIRTKKHTIQYEMNDRQQKANAEELSIAGLIDLLKEIKRDTETTVQCLGQELEKVENMFNDVASEFPLFPGACE